jgi:hypothetical protein
MTDTNDVATHSDGFKGAFPVVVDLSMGVVAGLPKLKTLGVKVILRYYALKE